MATRPGTAGGAPGAAPRIDPIEPRLRWSVLGRADIERLDAAVMEVLADVGVRFPLARALDALERGGCRVDRASQTARRFRRRRRRRSSPPATPSATSSSTAAAAT